MRILITSAASGLAQALADALSVEHTIRLTDRVYVAGKEEFAQSPLGHDASTRLLVAGMDAIVHVAEPLPGESDTSQIDYATRGTYNLLWAATEEQVRRVVFLSTLALMAPYDAHFNVTERWRPRPTTEPSVLAKHLGEIVCREFAREHKLQCVVLRLGRVAHDGDVQGQPDPLGVEQRDVIQAVRLALTANVGRWAVFHIQSDSPNARFSVASAKQVLGYAPEYQYN